MHTLVAMIGQGQKTEIISPHLEVGKNGIEIMTLEGKKTLLGSYQFVSWYTTYGKIYQRPDGSFYKIKTGKEINKLSAQPDFSIEEEVLISSHVIGENTFLCRKF